MNMVNKRDSRGKGGAETGVPRRGARQAKWEARDKRVRGALVFIVLVVALFLVMSSPIFTIREHKVLGNVNIKTEEVIDACGLNEGRNIFSFGSSAAKKALSGNAYLRELRVKKSYPSSVTIEIEERKPRSYVEFGVGGSYLIMDEEGIVLGASDYTYERLPVITGLKLSNFAVGKPLDTDNPAVFSNVVFLSQTLVRNELENVVEVEIGDMDKIHLIIDGVDFLFGDISDADEKVRYAKEVLAKLDGKRGSVDISDLSKKIIFKQFP